MRDVLEKCNFYFFSALALSSSALFEHQQQHFFMTSKSEPNVKLTVHLEIKTVPSIQRNGCFQQEEEQQEVATRQSKTTQLEGLLRLH